MGRLSQGVSPSLDARHAAERVAQLAADKKAKDVVVLDMSGVTIVADYFVIASAGNPTHARAVADAVAEAMSAAGQPFRLQEGYREGRWILQDYGGVLFHCFLEDVRRAFDLERLWGDAQRVAVLP